MLIILFKTTLICPLIGLAIVVAACNYLLAAQIQLLIQVYTDRYSKLLKSKLLYATSISEYAAVAVELDKVLGLDTWKKDFKSHVYDYHRVQLWTKTLQVQIESHSPSAVDRICDSIMLAQKTNFGGAFSPEIYHYTYWNTKDNIIDYQKTLIRALDSVSDSILASEAPSLKQISFVSHMHTLWGHCALILVGARAAMYYHLGVCQGLLRLRCVPHIIYAKETNALLGAWLVLHADTIASEESSRMKQDQEILSAIKMFQPKRCKWYGLTFRQRKKVLGQLSALFGDISLLEAYNLSGRQLNLICERADQYYVMNHKTMPDVSVTSAVLACMCNDVLQPTGGGALYPLLICGGEKAAAGLWGLVVSERAFLPPLLANDAGVGEPNDPLSGTPGREIIAAAYAAKFLLRELLRQLLTLLCGSGRHHYHGGGGSCSAQSWYSPSDIFRSLISFLSLQPKYLADIVYGEVSDTICDLLTSTKNGVTLAPQKVPFASIQKQIAIGLSTCFRNACLIKIKLDVEHAINALSEIASQTDTNICH